MALNDISFITPVCVIIFVSDFYYAKFHYILLISAHVHTEGYLRKKTILEYSWGTLFLPGKGHKQFICWLPHTSWLGTILSGSMIWTSNSTDHHFISELLCKIFLTQSCKRFLKYNSLSHYTKEQIYQPSANISCSVIWSWNTVPKKIRPATFVSFPLEELDGWRAS